MSSQLQVKWEWTMVRAPSWGWGWKTTSKPDLGSSAWEKNSIFWVAFSLWKQKNISKERLSNKHVKKLEKKRIWKRSPLCNVRNKIWNKVAKRSSFKKKKLIKKKDAQPLKYFGFMLYLWFQRNPRKIDEGLVNIIFLLPWRIPCKIFIHLDFGGSSSPQLLLS